MTINWVNKIHTFNVIKKEIPRPGGKSYFLNSSTLIGVLHTTEIKTVKQSWNALNDSSSGPHFITGEDLIIQCRPLNVQGAALRPGKGNTANVHAQIQIEMVAFSQEKLWLPPESTLKPTVAVMAFCFKHLGIPLRIPNNWPDNCSDIKTIWASNNTRRRLADKSGLWPKEKGWWMHLEVPFQANSWHWDCGALQRSTLITMASILAPQL